uniref:Uncharacterized protein n=1 Tax=Gelidium elegans TaxID=37200 RepID=A0A141SDM0_GELEL|nr:hypothetical protein Gele_138 [Gelidium elegans]AMK96388.1 hypothetical protein Gele_138 [Gelidium elegans]
MDQIILNNYLPNLHKISKSFALKLIQSKEIWLFNCQESCQHNLIKKNVKINNISKIILTKLDTDNISGLIGLLSSLNLIGRKDNLKIYSPTGIDHYLDLAKKYSQTNFKYELYIYHFQTGLIIEQYNYKLYIFVKTKEHTIFLISKEKYGQFKLNKANVFYLVKGPLYGQLKKDKCLLLPDGTIIQGNYFKSNNISGEQLALIKHRYHNRTQNEVSKR